MSHLGVLIGFLPLPAKALKGRKHLELDCDWKQWRNLDHSKEEQTESAAEERLLLRVGRHTHTAGTQLTKTNRGNKVGRMDTNKNPR